MKLKDNLNCKEPTFQQLANAMETNSYEELLSHLLNLVALIERKLYLENCPDDKGNGFRNRKLHAGSLSFQLKIPRTRNGNFRPFFLPEKWKRHSETDYLNLAYSLILSSKSMQAAKRALKELGIPFSENYFEELLTELREELKALNTSPLNPDWFTLIMDAKETKVKEDSQIIPYTIYTVAGISLDGKKQILITEPRKGEEKLEDWKEILKKLLNRGIRRVLIVVHDDFSGLLKLTKSYFPGADIQLCTVHLVRNAKKHLSASGYENFKRLFFAIKSSPSYEYASSLFEQLCEEVKKENSTYAERLRGRKKHYLAFLKYPSEVKSVIASTNMAEGLNRKIEDAELFCGGYFHSMENLGVKLAVMVRELHTGKWRKPTPKIAKVSHILYAEFDGRFKDD